MRSIGISLMSALMLLGRINPTTSLRVNGDKDYVQNQAGLRSELLAQYDKNIKPAHQVNVSVDMFVRTIQKLDIKEGTMELQLTFRQKWYDSRLVYNGKKKYSNVQYLTINNIDGDKLIWVPDTFFRNELESHVHQDLVNNEYLRVFPDGHVLYSSRISLKTACGMNLSQFPFDQQTCTLQLASYGFRFEDIQYVWKEANPIQLNPVINLKEYNMDFGESEDMTSPWKAGTCDVLTSTGKYSCLKVDFFFRRDGSYMTLTTLIPITMFVITSLFSLYISPKLLGCRLALSFGSLMAVSALAYMTNVLNGVPTGYTKTCDIYTGMSVFFIFLAVLASLLLEVFAKDEDLQQEKGGVINSLKNGSNIARLNVLARWLLPIIYLLFVIIFFASA